MGRFDYKRKTIMNDFHKTYLNNDESLIKRFEALEEKFPSIKLGLPHAEWWDKDGVGRQRYMITINKEIPIDSNTSYRFYMQLSDLHSWEPVFEALEKTINTIVLKQCKHSN